MYTEECIMTFLKNQGQLFDEPVAESYEEAEAFLEDCMAVVVDSLKEVKEYLEEMGVFYHILEMTSCISYCTFIKNFLWSKLHMQC